MFTLVRSPQPPQFTPQGFQNDGAGVVHLAVAHTNHGDIPAKAIGNNCWYAYGGAEHATNNFSWVEVKNASFVKSPQNPPPNAVICGHQNDGAGQLWAALAHTQWGNIPAKAKPGNAWFAYGGKEHATADFSWIVQSFGLVNVAASPHPPATAVAGNQTDGAGVVHLAVAHTQWGDIPAKAKGNQAWFPYGGAEHATNNFSWVSVPGYQLVPNQGSPPPKAVVAGHQNDGAGQLWAAIANTQWGTIPAKAIGNNAWFAYGGKEHTTNNFSWVVHQ